jgi:hypothetical protein
MVKNLLQIGVEGRVGGLKVDSAREIGVVERRASKGLEIMVEFLRECDTSH